MEIDIALAHNQNQMSGTWFEWAVDNTTYFKLKIALVGGYRGMSEGIYSSIIRPKRWE